MRNTRYLIIIACLLLISSCSKPIKTVEYNLSDVFVTPNGGCFTDTMTMVVQQSVMGEIIEGYFMTLDGSEPEPFKVTNWLEFAESGNTLYQPAWELFSSDPVGFYTGYYGIKVPMWPRSTDLKCIKFAFIAATWNGDVSQTFRTNDFCFQLPCVNCEGDCR